MTKRLINEAPAAWKTYTEAIKDFDVEFHSATYLKDFNDILSRDSTIVSNMKATGRRKIDIRSERQTTTYRGSPTTPRSNSPEIDDFGSVDCATPDLCYSLRTTGKESWHVLFVGANSEAVERYLASDDISKRNFYISSENVADLLGDKTLIIDNAESRAADPVSSVRMTFHRNIAKGSKAQIFGGWIDFVPDWNWIVLAYRVRRKQAADDSEGRMIDEVRYTYRAPTRDSPVALPQSESLTYHYTDGRPFDGGGKIEYTKFELREVPAAEFDMANFGVHTSLASSLSTFWRAVLYAANGIVFLAVAVWLYRRYQNARRAAA
ncbi:MAG TPA: hypothetical protein VFE24_12990 [Pirellulales bacterium]|nr:hypothetical protein [Pirellulales bacterium]